MGFLSKLWEKAKGQKTIDQIYARLPDSSSEDGLALPPDACYVKLFVNSLRLKDQRRFATTFHGVVYSFVTLHSDGQEDSEMAAVSKPNKLANLDPNSLGRVITVDKEMMGAVPWRGDNIQLELGLFSVKSGNLLTPVVDFVTKVSETAGVSFVGAVKPFLPLITQGMDMIAGQQDDTDLQVGLDTSIKLDKSGTYAVVDQAKGTLDPAKLSLDPADGKLLHNGQALQAGYFVFSIRRVDQKADFGEIPALKEKYAKLIQAMRDGKEQDAKEALAAFKREALSSQDLITTDALRLIQRATDRMKSVFGGGPISKGQVEAMDGSLASVDLYE